MTPVTQTLNPEPDICDETNQGEAPPPPDEEDRPQRTEDTTDHVV